MDGYVGTNPIIVNSIIYMNYTLFCIEDTIKECYLLKTSYHYNYPMLL